jgi:hypothetical protein
MLWLQLTIGDRRANRSGSAVCGLSGASARPKVVGSLAVLAWLAALAGLWATMNVSWPVWAVFIVAGWWYLPMMRTSLAAAVPRRALYRCRPAGRVVIVHTMASVEPGAGADLLKTVTDEADDSGWTLTLDAANERLASYYRQFGFVATGPAVMMPWGEANVPMARPPRTPGVAAGV